MAIVFSRDLLFVHVPKAGGSSVTAYLLEVLPPPVYYMAPGPLGRLQREGTVYLPGQPHRPLAAVGDLVRAHGFSLDAFPAIIAVVRNPYDLAVSNYAFQRRVSVPYELIDESRAPARPLPEPRRPEFEALVAALASGQVARIEPSGRTKVNALRRDLWQAAARLRRPLDLWDHGGLLYAALAPTPAPDPGVTPGRELAESLAFREYVLAEQRDTTRPWLSRHYDFYHLEGAVPPNLRIVRFERLAEGVREVLRSIGLTGDAEFPWLNRSDHGASASYYDAETEAAVHAQARWQFERGLYRRLDLTAAD